ncbi:uncharacterized protein LOC135126795 isoform X2 [Zophobas morio]|uniref:uncharacterized protein LOC135126795 isoform X2 n=1 Tax=Zophobas morio TaxID=2755281 RepID=UPI003082EACD
MNILPFFCIWMNLFLSVNLQVYECPNYELLKQPRLRRTEKSAHKIPLTCNFAMINPKKVINPYRNEVQNYVPSKPFGSVCVMCSMCLAVAREMDKLFVKIVKSNMKNKQTAVVDLITENIKHMCYEGFEKKSKQLQEVTNDFKCSTHVRTKMDGRWTEKLREMCATYLNYMDVQYLLNTYLNGTQDLQNYLCNNKGIFRDCSSLNMKNMTINHKQNTC